MTDAGRKPRVMPDDVLKVFDAREDRAEPLTAPELADALDCSRRTALNKLGVLADRGDVAAKKVGGRSKVWWTPIETSPESAGGETPREAATDEADQTTDDTTDADSGQLRAETDVKDQPDAGGDDLEPLVAAVIDALEDVGFPAGRKREACSAAVYAARDYLREHGPATMREIVAEVMPEHPLGYDVDGALEKVEAGDRYRGAWWRRVVKPGLKALPDVEAPARGASEWRYTGEA